MYGCNFHFKTSGTELNQIRIMLGRDPFPRHYSDPENGSDRSRFRVTIQICNHSLGQSDLLMGQAPLWDLESGSILTRKFVECWAACNCGSTMSCVRSEITIRCNHKNTKLVTSSRPIVCGRIPLSRQLFDSSS